MVFEQHITTPEDEYFISCSVDVSADSQGYFINITTDQYEGDAFMTLPCAILAHAALGKAIECALKKRESMGSLGKLRRRKKRTD